MTRSIATRYEVPVFATVLGGYAFLSGFASFLGWPLDIPRLTDWFNDDVSIQPNAAMLIMFSGAAIMLVERRAWRGVITLGVLVGVGGMAIMLQYLVGADFGFNHQLLFGRTWGQITTITPGRVGPPASASLALIGTALVLLGGAGIRPGLSRLRRFVPSIGIAVSTIMGFSLLGYLFGAREFYTIPSLTAIAFPTASMLLATGVALIASVPERDPMLLFRERSGVGVLARTTILALAIMIPLVLWLRVKGFEYGYYDTGMGRALGALILIIGTIVVVWTALMALRRHEHELREVGRRKDEFLATLAHELRNPLAPLTNALAILDASEGNEAIGRKTRKIMSRQLKHMVRLIDDLIDVSRISRGAVEIRKERLELNDVLQETVEAMRPICEESQQELCVERSPQPVWIEADRVRIAQIVSNLVSNASRYSRIGMPIEVHVSSEGRDVVLSVKDRGIGIPSEKQDTIFEMFSRGDTALKDHSGGLGIGLYLSRRLAEMHGGTVTAHSDGLDRGSEFILRLPVVSEAPNNVDSMALQSRATATDPPASRVRVLVVDDNRDAAESMAILLHACGYLAEEVYDGPKAVEAAESFKPDVVLLDIGLPGLSGYDVCRRMRQQPGGDKTVIIALTGWGNQEDRVRAADSGFDAHLVKPIEWPALIDVLETHLKEPSRVSPGSE